jgi:hypothetical protein
VKIGEDSYWDGGYSANPPLVDLAMASTARFRDCRMAIDGSDDLDAVVLIMFGKRVREAPSVR